MRVSPKLMLLVVCALAGSVFAMGKPAEEKKMTAKPTAEDVNTTTEEVKEAVEDVEEAAPVEEKKGETAAKEAIAPAAVPSAVKPAETSEGKDAAVTVNGEVITEAEVDAKLMPVLERAAMRMDPNSIELYKSRIRGQALDAMIIEKLLDAQVAKAGIKVTDSDVNDEINKLLAQQGISMENLGALLKMQGQSIEQFRQQMKKGVTYEALMNKEVGKIDVNDADALAFYEENKEDFNTPAQVQASHILIKVAPSATPEEKAAAKAKAEKLLKEIKDGADFATVARENSDDPGSKIRGGDLGFFGKGQMVKEFEDAAFGMQPGQVSDLVETQFGYHIIKVTGHKPAGLAPFAEVKDDIIKNLEQGKKNQTFRQYIQKLRAEANIVYPPGKEPAMTMPIGPGAK
ncbi:MAG: peptidylprolyl isomerase [Planctomycetota bacterium]